MEKITAFEAFSVTDETFVLPAYYPVPNLGVLPMNAFLIRGAQPTLIDSGPGPLNREVVKNVESLVDLHDLKFIWLTHTDPDHTGALYELLEAAPQARLVTTFLGAGKINLVRGVPLERFELLTPGQSVDIGDRELVAVRPPTYDAPETIAAFDSKSRTLFSADAFGALMDAPAISAAEIAPQRFLEGLYTWSSIDTPWLGGIEEPKFAKSIAGIRRLGADIVLSSHLPPAARMTDVLLERLLKVQGVCANADSQAQSFPFAAA